MHLAGLDRVWEPSDTLVVLRGVKTSRRKKTRKERDEEGQQKQAPPPDTIADPLKAPQTDPLKITELKDNLTEEVQHLRRRRKKRKDEEEEALGVPIAEAEEVLDDLLDNSDISSEELDVQALAEDDLEVEEVVELFEIDDLSTLMNELADLDALNDESPVVEAL
ncbi:MAG: hypothetical protein ACI8S6_003764, partial [Myxococcota bacterium]